MARLLLWTRRIYDFSLKAVKGISDVLLIFSHDYYDEAINRAVQQINFTAYVQVFYPYSMQLYETMFPGHANDAKTSNDPRIFRPDMFIDFAGHFRDEKAVQIKHHWWWKANMIFGHILKNVSDVRVAFLEEDYYVLPDALEVLELIESERYLSAVFPPHIHQIFSKCDPMSFIISLASNSVHFYQSNKVSISKSFPKDGSTFGLTLSRVQWNLIANFTQEFCNLDEYNWDFSLAYVLNKYTEFGVCCLIQGGRFRHTGKYNGYHSKTQSYDSISDYESQIQKLQPLLHPRELNFESTDLHFEDKTFGGWADPRDRAMCTLFSVDPGILTGIN